MARTGEEGLHELGSMIKAQLTELHHQKDLARFLHWLNGLTAEARDFEEVTLQIKEGHFHGVRYLHWRTRDERLFLESEAKVAAHLGNPEPTEDVDAEFAVTNSGPSL